VQLQHISLSSKYMMITLRLLLLLLLLLCHEDAH
jgi:hypothetical protein